MMENVKAQYLICSLLCLMVILGIRLIHFM